MALPVSGTLCPPSQRADVLAFICPLSIWEGGGTVVTLTELLQLLTLIVSIIKLMLMINNRK